MTRFLKFVWPFILVYALIFEINQPLNAAQLENTDVVSPKSLVKVGLIVGNKQEGIKFDIYYGFIDLGKIIYGTHVSCVAEEEKVYKVYVQLGRTSNLGPYSFGLNISEKPISC